MVAFKEVNPLPSPATEPPDILPLTLPVKSPVTSALTVVTVIVDGNLALLSVPEEIFVAFKAVKPEPSPVKLVTEISAGNLLLSIVPNEILPAFKFVNSEPSAIIFSDFIFPITSNFCVGSVVPTPRLPLTIVVKLELSGFNNHSLYTSVNTVPFLKIWPVICISPTISNFLLGISVPIPTFPETIVFPTTSRVCLGLFVPIPIFPPSATIIAK